MTLLLLLWKPPISSTHKYVQEHVGQLFLVSTQRQVFQISLHLYEHWLTYQMDGVDFTYGVENSVKCHDVASLLLYAITYP